METYDASVKSRLRSGPAGAPIEKDDLRSPKWRFRIPDIWIGVFFERVKMGGMMVGHRGLEPRTNGLRVHCSTS